MTNRTCAVPECEKPVRCKSLCYAHYMKLWRYGTPTPEHPARWEDITGRRFGSLVAIRRTVTHDRYSMWDLECDCGEMVTRYIGTMNRAGSTATCGGKAHRGDAAGYSAAHDRVRRDRGGSASNHRCADCGEPALHWSYNHDDPGELTAELRGGYVVAYSLEPAHYSPRCVPCHKRFDLDRIDAARVA